MKRQVSKPIAAFFLLLLSPFVLFAQGGSPSPQPATADQFGGNYKGSAKSPDGDIALTLEIKSEKGKISGRLITPQGEQPFTSSDLVDGKLTIKLGSGAGAGSLALQLRDGKAVGDWTADGQTRAVEFQTAPAATDAPVAEVKKSPEPSPADVLTGEWDASADAQGQAFPFTLTLKVEGEKVTGTSSSTLGNSTISTGSWKDGKLAIVLDAANGPIALIATMTDGKLVGDYDFAGQLQGKWVAIRKKP